MELNYRTPKNDLCPYCLGEAIADWIVEDLEFVKNGPYVCNVCGAKEIDHSETTIECTAEELKLGWLKGEV